jgi:hypothetical protein
MIDESNTDKGKAIATFVADAYIISSRIIYHSNPFPIRSSMYLNKNNISNTNITIRKVTIKGLIKALSNKRCIFFIKMTSCMGYEPARQRKIMIANFFLVI